MTKLRALALTLIIALVGFSSCKKTPSTVGNNLQPSNTFVKVFSTADNEIIAHTEHVDTIPTGVATTLLVGNMYDQIFGITKLQTFTQMSASISGQIWGENAVCDSIVLQLAYSGFYGDTTTMQHFIVREIDEGFTDSVTYYSTSLLATKDNPLADYTFQPHPNTYSNIDDDSLSKAVLRIPLDVSLGQSFIENEDVFETNEKFMEFFKGLNIDCENVIGNGAIYFFDATNSFSYMRLYYHNSTDTLYYDFNVTSANYHFGNFSHDFDAAVAPVPFNDSIDGRYLYVQGVAGTMVWLKFPEIASWAKSLNTNVMINEARLILTGAPATVNGAINDTATFAPPVQLIIVKKTGEGEYDILDDQYVGASYYGGQYNEEGTVFFRLNQYVQDLVLNGPDAENQGLYIIVNGGSYNPRRWVFNGPDFADTTRTIRMELTYSTIDTE